MFTLQSNYYKLPYLLYIVLSYSLSLFQVLLLAALLLITLAGSSPVPSDGLSEIAEGAVDPELDNIDSSREKREAGRSFSRFGAPTFVAGVGK